MRRPERLGVWAFPVSGSSGFLDGGSVAGGRSHCCSVSGEQWVAGGGLIGWLMGTRVVVGVSACGGTGVSLGGVGAIC